MLYKCAVFAVGLGVSLLLGTAVFFLIGLPVEAATRWAFAQLTEAQVYWVFVVVVAAVAFGQGWNLGVGRREKRRAIEDADER
jgi:hypothetical protein